MKKGRGDLLPPPPSSYASAGSLTVAAQNQSIRTNLVKAKIGKSQGDSLCRVCRKVDESIDHIVSGCKLAQKECKRRYDNLGEIVRWKLARK